VRGKIKNCRTLLRRNARSEQPEALARLARLAGETANPSTFASLLGLEGAAARTYFGAFPAMLAEQRTLPGTTFSFEGRNRRPPLDAVNCLLSFAYALLVKDLAVACWLVGLDPYIGIYHKPRYGRPALALDLAEEFRPLIADSLVINLLNNGEVGESDFVVRAGGVALTAAGRRAVLSGYERRLEMEIKHPLFGYRVSYRRLLDIQVRLFGALLLGEVPEYVAFTTR
jgi:CRISPR-associated protein Cas1